MIELVTDTSEGAGDRVTLFSIDGTEYTIPAKPRPNIALKYLRDLKVTKNAEMAAASLLEALLGPEGWEALTNFDDLTTDQFKKLLEVARDVSLGGMEDALGN